MSLRAALVVSWASSIQLFLIKSSILHVLVLSKSCWRSSLNSSAIYRLHVTIDLLVVQHLVQEVTFEVITRATLPRDTDICCSWTICLMFSSETQWTLCLHGVIVLKTA